jgi:hypothetical protein
MRYTKIITLTGNGISGSVRIEGTGGRTTAAVKIRQPLPQKPVLFLLFGNASNELRFRTILPAPRTPKRSPTPPFSRQTIRARSGSLRRENRSAAKRI